MRCLREGKYLPLHSVDKGIIRSSVEIADSDFRAASMLANLLEKEAPEWSSVYKLYYDSLRELAESLIRFDKVKIENHQCLFAYLCKMHPELELSWEFLEKVRTKRNGINYHGTKVAYQDWQEVDLQFKLYMRVLRNTITKQLLA